MGTHVKKTDDEYLYDVLTVSDDTITVFCSFTSYKAISKLRYYASENKVFFYDDNSLPVVDLNLESGKINQTLSNDKEFSSIVYSMKNSSVYAGIRQDTDRISFVFPETSFKDSSIVFSDVEYLYLKDNSVLAVFLMDEKIAELRLIDFNKSAVTKIKSPVKSMEWKFLGYSYSNTGNLTLFVNNKDVVKKLIFTDAGVLKEQKKTVVSCISESEIRCKKFAGEKMFLVFDNKLIKFDFSSGSLEEIPYEKLCCSNIINGIMYAAVYSNKKIRIIGL